MFVFFNPHRPDHVDEKNDGQDSKLLLLVLHQANAEALVSQNSNEIPRFIFPHGVFFKIVVVTAFKTHKKVFWWRAGFMMLLPGDGTST